MALTKVTEGTLYALAATASNVVSIGSAVDCSTWFAAAIKARMGRGTASAFTVGPTLRLEGSFLTSPTADDWVSLGEHQMAIGASIGSQAFNATEAIGQTTLTLAAITNLGAGDYCFIENTTLASSEWVRIVSSSGADVVIEEGLTVQQTAAASIMRDQAEQVLWTPDLTSFQRIRLVVGGAGSGQEVIVEAMYGAVTGL